MIGPFYYLTLHVAVACLSDYNNLIIMQTVEDEILEALCSAQDKGLDDTQLAKQLPGISDEQRVQALNELIQKSRIQVL